MENELFYHERDLHDLHGHHGLRDHRGHLRDRHRDHPDCCHDRRGAGGRDDPCRWV